MDGRSVGTNTNAAVLVVGVAAFGLQVALPVLASQPYPLRVISCTLPHLVLAIVGIAALLFGRQDGTWVSAAVGLASLVITALLYTPSFIWTPPYSAITFGLFLMVMWLVALIGSLICGVAVYRLAGFRRTVR
ncbi:MAG: hypothetical protein AAFX41_05065 [Bacteroidota bacterium]